VGQQSGIDPERLGAVAKLFEERYLEAEPGSVVFFHCNTLHASEANHSDRPRRAYICAYNAFSNVPVVGEGHGQPVPLKLSDEEAILRFATVAR
jgi:ectoine hydroxylase-related dioxygenase (phytanoyl-CoA dioxygenase family)